MDTEKLRQHPEYMEINWLGEKKGFLLSMYGADVAANKGEEVVPRVLDIANRIAGFWLDEDAEDIEVGSDEMAQRLKGLIRNDDTKTLSVIVWWGLLTFDPDLELEEVQMCLTFGTLINLFPRVVQKAMNFADDMTEEDVEFAESRSSNGESEGKNSTEQKSKESA